MVDQYGRTIEYLRISVTDRCNLRCSYCMPREGICARTHQEMLRYEEIVRAVQIFQKLGIRKIKITGGEPLVKKNLEELISSLSGIRGIEELTLTTNGVYLAHQAETLREAGIKAVNISLDTLDRDQYWRLTGEDALPRVLEGIQRALESGFRKVKINAVILQGVNEDAVVPLAALAKTSSLAVRFIEIMPVGMGVSYRGLEQQAVQEKLEQEYGKLEAHIQENRTEGGASPGNGASLGNGSSLGNGPAVYYRLPGFQGEIGFISALSHSFCDRCNRLRLTADGQLKTCLDAPPVLDVRALLRGGRTDGEIEEAVRKAIYEKPARHHFADAKDADREKRVMTQIGG